MGKIYTINNFIADPAKALDFMVKDLKVIVPQLEKAIENNNAFRLGIGIPVGLRDDLHAKLVDMLHPMADAVRYDYKLVWEFHRYTRFPDEVFIHVPYLTFNRRGSHLKLVA